MHADHAGILGIMSVKGALTHQGIAHGSINKIGKLTDLCCSTRNDRTAADIYERLLRCIDKLGDLIADDELEFLPLLLRCLLLRIAAFCILTGNSI